VPLGTHDPHGAAVSSQRRQEETARERRPLVPKKIFDELFVSMPRLSFPIVLGDDAAFTPRAAKPNGVGVKMDEDRGEKMLVDLRKRSQTFEVVLEANRDRAAGKARKIEHRKWFLYVCPAKMLSQRSLIRAGARPRVWSTSRKTQTKRVSS